MKELNYPVKYAILGINEQTGWSLGVNESERIFQICGYIVSKVYILGERIEYFKDGTHRKTFLISYPYPNPYNKIRVIPSKCNGVITDIIFDDFNSAKKVSTERNKKLRSKVFTSTYFSTSHCKEDIAKKLDEFDGRIESYIKMEEEILNSTNDMIVLSEELPKVLSFK